MHRESNQKVDNQRATTIREREATVEDFARVSQFAQSRERERAKRREIEIRGMGIFSIKPKTMSF